MKVIKFRKNCNFNGKEYKAGDELKKVTNYSDLWKLNEKGFIKPLSENEFIKLKKQSKKKEDNLI